MLCSPSNSLDTNTRIRLSPHVSTIWAHARVPLNEVRQTDVVVANDLATLNACISVVELLAVGDHAWLCGLGCLNAIPCACGWSRSCCLRRCAPENAHTHVDVCLHTRAVVTNSWVPLRKVGERDLFITNDLTTRYAGSNPMELRTISHHPRLSGQRRRNTIPGTCGGADDARRLAGGGGGLFPNDTDAGISLSPEAGAVASGFGVPGKEFVQGDAETTNYVAALVVCFDKVKLITVGDNFWLSWERRFDTGAN